MKITTEQIRKFDRKFNREEELRDTSGWKAINRTHKSKKTYTRKNKHKNLE